MAGKIIADIIEATSSQIKLNVGNVTVLTADNSGWTSAFANGSASVPSITTIGDTNTGVYFPAADTVAITTGGIERMRVFSDGALTLNTGVSASHTFGYNESGAEISLVDSTGNGVILIDSALGGGRVLKVGNGTLTIGTTGTGSLQLVANNTLNGFIDSAGNFAFNSGYGSAAKVYGCRAWVNFNGTGTVAIRGSGNVSSITDSGTGGFVVNFTTSFVDANYSAVASCNGGGGRDTTIFVGMALGGGTGTYSVSACDIYSFDIGGGVGADSSVITFLAIR